MAKQAYELDLEDNSLVVCIETPDKDGWFADPESRKKHGPFKKYFASIKRIEDRVEKRRQQLIQQRQVKSPPPK